MATLNQQYDKMQHTVSANEDNLQTVMEKVNSLQKEVDKIWKNRQSNLLIVCIPEGMEGRDMVAFAIRLLTHALET